MNKSVVKTGKIGLTWGQWHQLHLFPLVIQFGYCAAIAAPIRCLTDRSDTAPSEDIAVINYSNLLTLNIKYGYRLGYRISLSSNQNVFLTITAQPSLRFYDGTLAKK